MGSTLIWNNLLRYSLQLGLLVGVAAFVPALLRLRMPGARLFYLQALLAVCLLLPAVQPWRQEVADSNVLVTTSIVTVRQVAAARSFHVPWREMALWILAAGALARLGWLAMGFRKLGRYRRNGRRLGLRQGCPVMLSDEITGPVTFGFLSPVILLPARFPYMEPQSQEAILCHELLHVERRDWLFILGEELVRAIFWFHPAIWWVLGEIQLAREQAVDREVVVRTQARDQYVDALLNIATAGLHPDVAPAPLFLRRRHLKQRVISIFQEDHMSKTKLISRLAVGLAMVAAACWLVTGTVPLAAAPQSLSDAAGVSVDVGGAQMLHRSPVEYPAGARQKRVQGVVILDATLDANGNVTDARVVSGPDELRRASLDSVLQWHFAHGAAGAVQPVKISFQLPDGPVLPTVVRSLSTAANGKTLANVNVSGLSEQNANELMGRLPVHRGDVLTADLLAQTEKVVRDFDEHLRVMAVPTSETEAHLQIVGVNSEPKPDVPQRIKIGGTVQQSKLIRQPHPVYPPDAKEARIQGVVKLSAIIGKDGTVIKLEVISGHPLLVPSALEAVTQWVYQPTLLNGVPVEVLTQIDVNYTLSQ